MKSTGLNIRIVNSGNQGTVGRRYYISREEVQQFILLFGFIWKQMDSQLKQQLTTLQPDDMLFTYCDLYFNINPTELFRDREEVREATKKHLDNKFQYKQQIQYIEQYQKNNNSIALRANTVVQRAISNKDLYEDSCLWYFPEANAFTFYESVSSLFSDAVRYLTMTSATQSAQRQRNPYLFQPAKVLKHEDQYVREVAEILMELDD